MNRDKLRAALRDADISSLSGDGPAALLLQGKAYLLTRRGDWVQGRKKGLICRTYRFSIQELSRFL